MKPFVSPVRPRASRLCVIATVLAASALFAQSASAALLRVVTYNIEADISGYTTPRPNFSTVLQGIGSEVVAGHSQPLDILALQETTSNTTTVQPVVTALNSLYGSGTYAMSSYQATQTGSASSGNGPNALVYNTKTLTLLASHGLGTSGGNVNREPVRYEFQPVGASASQAFYVYVSHYKSGTGSSNASDRANEATLIRNDANALPAGSRILYTGDFNTSTNNEAMFTTLMAAGGAQAADPLNPSGGAGNILQTVSTLSDSSTGLRYRDDYEMVTQNVLTDSSGLQYVAGSYHVFGNNGSVSSGGRVDDVGNTALGGLISPTQSQALSALTTASDHLPVVADFSVTVPEPSSVLLIASGLFILTKRQMRCAA